jgi:glycogen debranching enzyme
LDHIGAGYDAAAESLRRSCCGQGLKASGSLLGHHQIWARDSIIASLGARFIPDAGIHAALEQSLIVLRDRRSSGGAIPNNVDCATLRPNFRAYADGGLWWIVGSSLMNPDPEVIKEVLRWYECQDVDQSGLLSLQESSDWQDLFCTRGKGLYLNCLYVLALQCAARVFDGTDDAEAGRARSRADLVSQRINTYFWYAGDRNLFPHLSLTFSTEGNSVTDSLGRPRWFPRKLYLADEHYYLPYLAFRNVGEWFDSFGNLLAILSGVADRRRTEIILNFIERYAMNTWPVRSLTPVVRPGDPDWRDYYGALNAPDRYHNGGVWPFLGGFYVAALVKAGQFEVAAQMLEKLARLNHAGHFNEWHHGETGEPMGAEDQAWSAGMYLFARECVHRRQVPTPF